MLHGLLCIILLKSSIKSNSQWLLSGRMLPSAVRGGLCSFCISSKGILLIFSRKKCNISTRSEVFTRRKKTFELQWTFMSVVIVGLGSWRSFIIFGTSEQPIILHLVLLNGLLCSPPCWCNDRHTYTVKPKHNIYKTYHPSLIESHITSTPKPLNSETEKYFDLI